MNAFQSTAFAMLRAAEERDSALHDKKHGLYQEGVSMSVDLSRADWVRAMIDGADERSPGWRHLLLVSGLLIGFEGQDRRGLSSALRVTLESSLVDIANQAAKEARTGEELGAHCVTLVLNYTFELLSNDQRSRLDYDVGKDLLTSAFLKLICLGITADINGHWILLGRGVSVRKFLGIDRYRCKTGSGQ